MTARIAAENWQAAKVWRALLLVPVIPKTLTQSARRLQYTASILDPIAGELERYMDLLSARQKLVASNIANADTPGYTAKDIDFQSEFANAMDLSPNVVEVAGLPVRNDGNNANLDRESRLLMENATRFQVASSLMRSEIRLVKNAIDEGRNG